LKTKKYKPSVVSINLKRLSLPLNKAIKSNN